MPIIPPILSHVGLWGVSHGLTSSLWQQALEHVGVMSSYRYYLFFLSCHWLHCPPVTWAYLEDSYVPNVTEWDKLMDAEDTGRFILLFYDSSDVFLFLFSLGLCLVFILSSFPLIVPCMFSSLWEWDRTMPPVTVINLYSVSFSSLSCCMCLCGVSECQHNNRKLRTRVICVTGTVCVCLSALSCFWADPETSVMTSSCPCRSLRRWMWLAWRHFIHYFWKHNQFWRPPECLLCHHKYGCLRSCSSSVPLSGPGSRLQEHTSTCWREL